MAYKKDKLYDDLVYRPAEDAGRGENMVLRLGPGEQQPAGENMVRVRDSAKTAALNGDALAGQYMPPTSDSLLGSYNQYLDAYKNNKFRYDFNTDPVFQQAKESYLRQGRLNARDVAAQAAALTGGYGNSYGTVAAQSVMNQAAERINDLIPDLQNAAYGRYQAEQARNMNLAQMYYQMYGDQYQRELNNDILRAQYEDYGGLNARGIDTSKYEANLNDQRAYEKWLQDRQKTEAEQSDADRLRNQQLADAQLKAQYLDYSGLEGLGYDVSAYRNRMDAEYNAEKQSQDLQLALALAKNLGDFRMLESLGYPTDYLRQQMMAQDSSGGSGGNGGTTRYRYTDTDLDLDGEDGSTAVDDFKDYLKDTTRKISNDLKDSVKNLPTTGADYTYFAKATGAIPKGQGTGRWKGYTFYTDEKGNDYYVKAANGTAEVYKKKDNGTFAAYNPITQKWL